MPKSKSETVKTEFIKLMEGDTIEGTFIGFGKSQFGAYIKIQNKAGINKVSINATVLNNIFKTNIEKFIDKENESVITITKLDKPAGKKYYKFEVYLNDELLESTNDDLSASDLKEMFS